ncbi:MAG: hypothetical protein ABI895_19740 [Deltaproteobacteria bacterium]
MFWCKLRAVLVASGVRCGLLVALSALGCAELTGTTGTVTGDDPNVNQVTAARQKNLPYCAGGNRARSCVFGQNCRVTEQGCQVCQCQTLE